MLAKIIKVKIVVNNISLDQIGNESKFDLKLLYEEEENYLSDTDVIESPFENTTCEYYEPENFNNLRLQSRDCLSIFHLNCRSLSANWERFHDLLCSIHNQNFAFDFIGFSEVFDCSRDDRLFLPGYHN